MMKRFLLLGFLASAFCLFGQLDSNSVTVTASRDSTQTPDQVGISVRVTSPVNTSLDDVLAALAGSGITAANFSSLYGVPIFLNVVGSNQQPMPALEWDFRLIVPFSKLKDTLATLTSLQQSLAKKNSGLTVDFSVSGTSASSTPGCLLSDLIADGKVQAQKLASAAGLSVGSVLAMSQFVSTANGVTAPPCSLTIKFALLRY